MNESRFAESAMPRRSACLGLPLKHYSIRLEMLLIHQQNGLLCLSWSEFNALTSEKQVSELVKAVLICCARRPKFIRLWEWLYQDCDFALAIADFRNYLAEGRAMMSSLSPSSEEDKEAYEIASKGEKLEGGRALGSPMISQMILFAIKELRTTQDEALDAPFGHLGNLYLAHLESLGAIAVENQSEMDARSEMAKQRAELIAEKAAARKAWSECSSESERKLAFEKHPRIGNLFAEEWNNAKSDEEKANAEARWPNVAEIVLTQAGLKGITICQD